MQSTFSNSNESSDALTELERGVHEAIKTYSNVHRGSGHHSMVSTHLYEHARDIMLEYLGLDKGRYTVIFATPRRAAILMKLVKPESYYILSSQDIGLSLGIRALVIKRKELPKGSPSQPGGGTTKLISKDWVIWAEEPDKFEPGTPAILNIIAFAKAISMVRHTGNHIFTDGNIKKLTAFEILYHDELGEFNGQLLLDELRQTLIGRNVLVPTMKGARHYINLDNSSSTPTFTPIWNAFRQTWSQPVHWQKEIIDEVKVICAGVLGAPLATYDVIFTSNTTEAINLVAENMSRDFEEGTEPVLLSTLLEHSSNDLPWRMVPYHSLIRLSVDDEGFFDLNKLDELLCSYNRKGQYGNKRIKLVAVSGASNVLGVCNDVAEISRIAQRYGAHLLVDAAQLVAHRKVDMVACGIDYLAFSAHKVYAPFGCGVLVARKGLLKFSSAEMESIRSSGEENAGGIAALGKALILLHRIGIDLIQHQEKVLIRRALLGLSKIAGLRIYGIKDPDSPMLEKKIGVIVFGLKNMMPDRVAKELAMQCGIGVRYGCHCAHILIKHLLKISPLFERFQGLIQYLFPKSRFPGLVRISLGIENNEEDVDTLIQVLSHIARQQPDSRDRHPSYARKGSLNLHKADVQRQIEDFTRASALKVYSQS